MSASPRLPASVSVAELMQQFGDRLLLGESQAALQEAAGLAQARQVLRATRDLAQRNACTGFSFSMQYDDRHFDMPRQILCTTLRWADRTIDTFDKVTHIRGQDKIWNATPNSDQTLQLFAEIGRLNADVAACTIQVFCREHLFHEVFPATLDDQDLDARVLGDLAAKAPVPASQGPSRHRPAPGR